MPVGNYCVHGSHHGLRGMAAFYPSHSPTEHAPNYMLSFVLGDDHMEQNGAPAIISITQVGNNAYSPPDMVGPKLTSAKDRG